MVSQALGQYLSLFEAFSFRRRIAIVTHVTVIASWTLGSVLLKGQVLRDEEEVEHDGRYHPGGCPRASHHHGHQSLPRPLPGACPDATEREPRQETRRGSRDPGGKLLMPRRRHARMQVPGMFPS